MHLVIKTLSICLLIGLSFGIYFYITDDHRPVRIFISLSSTVCIGVLMMLAISFRHYFIRFSGRAGLKVVIMIALLVATALLGSEMALFLQSLLMTEQPYQPFNGGHVYALNILIVLVIGIPIYASEESKNMLTSKLLGQQYRVLQLEQQQTVFELELLRAKINPHFLYNVHNTIAGLISKDPAKAEELVLLLSKFFRSTLTKNSATFHTVADELDLVRTYLHMQQIRYEHRMSYSIQADPEALSLQMPSFVLQPLVENAIKHGIEASAENGYVTVSISPEGENVLITVADSGPAFPGEPGTGLGLSMIINKLRLLYADAFKLEMNNTPQKYVRLTIPRRN